MPRVAKKQPTQECKPLKKVKKTTPVKKTRIEYTLSEIERLSKFCKTTEQEFFGFTALDQCLKRLINICQQS